MVGLRKGMAKQKATCNETYVGHGFRTRRETNSKSGNRMETVVSSAHAGDNFGGGQGGRAGVMYVIRVHISSEVLQNVAKASTVHHDP